MSIGSKQNIILLIISIIISGGTFYYIGRGPIAGLQEEIGQIGSENLVLQSQVEELTDSNNELLNGLEVINENLSATQLAFQTLLVSYEELSDQLNSTQSDLEDLISSYEESQANYRNYLELYSIVWENYANLISTYNNLSSMEPVGEMTFTRIPGVVSGEFNEGGGWVKQGKGGQGPPYASLWQFPTSTYLIQSVAFSSKDQGIVFNYKPSPYGAEFNFRFSINGITVFSGTFSGVNENFDWEEVVIPFEPIYEMKELYGARARGQVTWYGLNGSDYEIFLYDGSSIIQLTYNLYGDVVPQIHNGQVTWYGDDGSDLEIFLYDGSSKTQLTYNNYNDNYPQIHNGQVTWSGSDGSDFEIFVSYEDSLWTFIEYWGTTIQNGITSITTLVQGVIDRLDTIEAELEVKKLDLQVHQHPSDKYTFCHIGASLEGLPVKVELETVFARIWDETNNVGLWEDITLSTWSRSFAPGHLRLQINLPEDWDPIFFQIIIRHDDGITMRYGTYLTPNQNSKLWTKEMGK